METRSQKFKARLGFFVAGGILIFIMAVFIIGKQKNLFNPVFKLTASFYNVGGLKVGNNIRFSGINVGTIDNIRIINDSTVEVEMLIRQNIRKFIKSDSKAAIGSEGLIGDKLLIITQGSTDAQIVAVDQQLESVEPIEIDAIIASLKLTVAHTEVVTEELAQTMMKINSGKGTLGRLIHDTEIAQNLSSTIVNFENTSQVLDETMKDTKRDIANILETLQLTADNAKASTQEFEKILVGINNPEGSIGRLIHDTITSTNLDETIYNLKRSSKGLDENLEALKHNFLFRGYFRRKAKEDAAMKELKDSVILKDE